MDKGMREMIYMDPVTQCLEEGLATLMKLVREDTEFETWLVKFDDDPELYERKVMK